MFAPSQAGSLANGIYSGKSGKMHQYPHGVTSPAITIGEPLPVFDVGRLCSVLAIYHWIFPMDESGNTIEVIPVQCGKGVLCGQCLHGDRIQERGEQGTGESVQGQGREPRIPQGTD